MARIRRDSNTDSHVRYGGPDGVTFDSGEEEIEVDDETASWAVETFDVIEYASGAPDADPYAEDVEPEIESTAEPVDEDDATATADVDVGTDDSDE